MAGSKPKGATIRQTKTFIDIQELIAENIERNEQLVHNDPESETSKVIVKKIAKQMLANG